MTFPESDGSEYETTFLHQADYRSAQIYEITGMQSAVVNAENGLMYRFATGYGDWPSCRWRSDRRQGKTGSSQYCSSKIEAHQAAALQRSKTTEYRQGPTREISAKQAN